MFCGPTFDATMGSGHAYICHAGAHIFIAASLSAGASGGSRPLAQTFLPFPLQPGLQTLGDAISTCELLRIRALSACPNSDILTYHRQDPKPRGSIFGLSDRGPVPGKVLLSPLQAMIWASQETFAAALHFQIASRASSDFSELAGIWVDLAARLEYSPWASKLPKFLITRGALKRLWGF